MNQLTVLKMASPTPASPNAIYPVVLKDEKDLILVDCGRTDTVSQLREAARNSNIDLNEITKIIITHQDYDHTGNLAELKQLYPSIEILSSREEADYINGTKKPLRLQELEAVYDTLPESKKEDVKKMMRTFGSAVPAHVDAFVQDGQVLPWCGGVEVIATPGHMPGHISLYVKEFKILITGDALGVQNGELGLANPQYNGYGNRKALGGKAAVLRH